MHFWPYQPGPMHAGLFDYQNQNIGIVILAMLETAIQLNS